jgi:protein-S-isoprenylcysteine O-methyltransferase Ste14
VDVRDQRRRQPTWRHTRTWDPPRQLVAVGPYRFVRNPIYLAAMLTVLGEAWLFAPARLLLYAGLAAVFFQLLVLGYKEPKLQARFGEQYQTYQRTVPRWIPRRPAHRDRSHPPDRDSSS